MVKQVVQGYERTEVLRTAETITKLDSAKEKLDKLWHCFKIDNLFWFNDLNFIFVLIKDFQCKEC